MKINFAVFLIAWLCAASTFVCAQGIGGKVTDNRQQPLVGASVYLMKDSVLVKTALADASGMFSFSGVKGGTYHIQVSKVGFVLHKTGLLKPDTSLILTLQPEAKELKEIVVTSRRAFVEQKLDRTVVNVDALISNAGATALDVLEKSPGVLIDQSGAISLKGKGGVKIYIDDKPTYLSGSELENYLRSLASSAIDQIELMSNPPARYDAAGNGGVINIRLKRNKSKGFNGGLNLSYAQGSYAKTNNGMNFTYRYNKINLFGNFSYNVNNGFNDLDINRHFLTNEGLPDYDFLQNSFIRRKSGSYNAKVGLDYYFSEKSTFGVVVNGLLNPGNVNTLNKSSFINRAGYIDSTIVALNRQENRFRNGSLNLNYRHRFEKEGQEITFDADYLRYQNNIDQSFDNTGSLPDGGITTNELLTGHLPSNIRIWSGKTDYAHPFSDGFKLESGLKSSYTQTDNVAAYFLTQGGKTTPDYGKTNHFIYKERISAGYLNLNKSWKRISVQLGLRFENTRSDAHQLGNIERPDSAFQRSYNGLFPTAYFEYKLDSTGTHSINLNYGRRIDRPYYEDLNPFLSPLDKFTYYTGNPFLRPAYTNNLELSYTFKNITAAFNYSKTKDEVNETIEIVDGIYYSRPGNLGQIVVKGASVDAGFDLAKWFNFHLYGSLTNIHTTSQFYTGLLNTQGTFVFVRPVFKFNLPSDWTAQLDAGYQSKVTNAQFVASARGKINAAMTKRFSPSLSLSLVGNDLFYTFKNAGDINNLANVKANFLNRSDTRTVVLSLNYRFGQAITGLRKHNANGAESEKNRVKN
ncbi:TonB-dependent receptor [Pedobacter yulinensis]|uniref:TonB-dependent receptor n=1 Tax=Pedobacter yulinensis TaxID=2126353 RepID=A0A2T3HLE0_9SPHI|nr:outer membrane beta-barrel protein [Pedobacter yulinensis]PST83236.1 TonB-dependent receptor [Pedobacter yulinensis]